MDIKIFSLLVVLVLLWANTVALAQYDEDCEYECTIVYCDLYGGYCDYDCYEVCYPYRYSSLMQSSTDLQATKSANFPQAVMTSLHPRLRQLESTRFLGSNQKSRTGNLTIHVCPRLLSHN